MNKYKNGKIYKLVSESCDDVYYGSTTQTLSSRLSDHKYNLKKNRRGVSKNIMINDDVKIILVELYPCNSMKELNNREGYYIINNKCINKQQAGRTEKQYNTEYRKTHKQQIKKYYQNRKNEFKIKRICVCGGITRTDMILRHYKSKKHIDYMNNPFINLLF